MQNDDHQDLIFSESKEPAQESNSETEEEKKEKLKLLMKRDTIIRKRKMHMI